MLNLSPRERIQKNSIVDQNGCWIWQLKTDTRQGKLPYGRMRLNNKHRLAHRVSYEAFVGEIPQDLQIDHLCRQPSCVNPNHLEPVTVKENLHRSSLKQQWSAKKQIRHCPKGHEYSETNTLTKKNVWGRPARNCRQCHRDRESRRYYAKKGLVYAA